MLLHAHTPRAALVGRIAARLAGVPLVYHLHSPTAADSTAPLAEPAQLGNRAVEPRVSGSNHRRVA